LGDKDFSNETITHALVELRISISQQPKFWVSKKSETENKTPADG
jgi:hypothetical protein